MNDPTINKDKVLTQAALQKQGAINLDSLAEQTKWLISLLKIILKIFKAPQAQAIRGYLDYYKTHLIVLASILDSIKKAEPVEKLIAELEDNINRYVNDTSQFVARVRDFPSSPWQNVKLGPAIIIMAPILKEDQRFVQEWNTYLNTYQSLIQNAMEISDFLAQQGRDIERETPHKITELTAEVQKIKETISLDIVIKHRYEDRLKFIRLLLEKVQKVRAGAEEAFSFLQKALVEAQKAQRL